MIMYWVFPSICVAVFGNVMEKQLGRWSFGDACLSGLKVKENHTIWGHLRMAARYCVCRARGRKRRCFTDSQTFNIGLWRMEESLSLVATATAICFLAFGGQITQRDLKILRTSENLKLKISFKYIEDRC